MCLLLSWWTRFLLKSTEDLLSTFGTGALGFEPIRSTIRSGDVLRFT
uniref:Uncharacterized protein n=1 Tax=Arundo donax TaxID=35708 RepID=A0A0A9AXR4_ARUDO